MIAQGKWVLARLSLVCPVCRHIDRTVCDPKISANSETLWRKTGGQMSFVLPSEHCRDPIFTSLHQKYCIPLFTRSMPSKITNMQVTQGCQRQKFVHQPKVHRSIAVKAGPIMNFVKMKHMPSTQSLYVRHTAVGLLWTALHMLVVSHTNKLTCGCRKEHAKVPPTWV